MRLKQMSQWTVTNSLKGYAVFLAIYFAAVMAMTIFFNATIIGVTGTSSGSFSAGSSAIFMLVFGIITFASYLRVGFANGVSRKTVFVSFVICAVILAVVAALGEILITVMGSLIMGYNPTASFTYLAPGSNAFVQWAMYFLMTLCSGLSIFTFGLFIGGAFYRMSKMAKIIASVFAGIFFFFGIPSLVLFVQVEFLQVFIMEVLLPIVNFFISSAWNSMLGYMILVAIFLFASWLIIRRAPAKSAK